MSHESRGESDDWYTPRYIFDALGETFDLDVAAPVEGPRYVPTRAWLHENGLEAEWRGFVWMNPPFGHQREKLRWLEKFVQHDSGIALLPDRTSTSWWQRLASRSDAVLFVSPKIKFERPDGSLGVWPTTGTCLFARGARAVRSLRRSGLGLTLSLPTPDEDIFG